MNFRYVKLLFSIQSQKIKAQNCQGWYPKIQKLKGTYLYHIYL